MADTETWPTDEKGNPKAKVSISLEEKIGLPNYSNVSIWASVTRFADDTEEGRLEGLREAGSSVETILAEEREPVLSMIQGK